jgi:hypothetical protein
MHLHAAALVFDGWSPSPDYSDQVGEIHCCGKSVVMRHGKIMCETCDTLIEQKNGDWTIVRVKGKPPVHDWRAN